jgi:hypothetical protein
VSSGVAFFNHLSSAVGGIPTPLSFLQRHFKTKKVGEIIFGETRRTGNYFAWDNPFFSKSTSSLRPGHTDDKWAKTTGMAGHKNAL